MIIMSLAAPPRLLGTVQVVVFLGNSLKYKVIRTQQGCKETLLGLKDYNSQKDYNTQFRI